MKELDAIKLVDTISREHRDDFARKFVRSLEVLGLIKFENPNKLKIKTMCDCSVADECPQGKTGMSQRCIIWKDDLT